MPDRDPATASRRERPAKPALTRDGIVAAAVEVMGAEGLERVTMRRLAQELDTGAASLYVYVRDTAELHAAVLDQLLGAVDLSPASAAGDWRTRLIAVLRSYTAVLFEHPALARSALVTRPSGERYLDLVEALLGLLHQGGMTDDRAAWAVDLLLLYATTTAGEQGLRGEAGDALGAALLAVSPDRHPQIARLGVDLVSGTETGRLAWGFDVLINGILTTARAT